MAYATGTVANAATLLATLQAFATSNGWLLTGNVLSKGNSYTNVTAPSADTLSAQGCLDTGFSVGVCPYAKSISIRASSWPVIYHLFTFTNPDMLFLVCQFDVDWCQIMYFGDMVKINPAAFTGGNLFFASRDLTTAAFATTLDMQHDGLIAHTLSSSGYDHQTPYFTSLSVSYYNSGVYCTIDGDTWPAHTGTYSGIPKIVLSPETAYMVLRQPNAWNQQTLLIPIHLNYKMANDYLGYLGFLEHIRFIRLNNYNIGDIITLGTDRWKVFSWKFKDMAQPNGTPFTNAGDTYYSTTVTVGSLGFAIRYDGP